VTLNKVFILEEQVIQSYRQTILLMKLKVWVWQVCLKVISVPFLSNPQYLWRSMLYHQFLLIK